MPNSAGGYANAVDDWARLQRFLILGSEGGSYYATEPAVLALAIAAGLGHTAAASEALPKVCRTGTHLFAFAEAVQGLRGWGRGLRKGIAGWYEGKSPEALAYQVAKYQRRDGWSHRDLLRLAHPAPAEPARQAIYRWVVGGPGALWPREVRRGEAVASYPEVAAHLHRLLAAMEEARVADRAAVIRLIREDGLPRVHPDGTPERPGGLGGAPGVHAADGDGA
jgi:60 kDa SS-A/Ro ribonucleoprotein